MALKQADYADMHDQMQPGDVIAFCSNEGYNSVDPTGWGE